MWSISMSGGYLIDKNKTISHNSFLTKTKKQIVLRCFTIIQCLLGLNLYRHFKKDKYHKYISLRLKKLPRSLKCIQCKWCDLNTASQLLEYNGLSIQFLILDYQKVDFMWGSLNITCCECSLMFGLCQNLIL